MPTKAPVNPITKVVVAARAAARDLARAKWTSNLLTERRSESARLTTVAKQREEAQKELDRANFLHANAVAEGNPDVEDFKKDAEEAKKYHDEQVKDFDAREKSINERIAEIDKEIADVASGEKKVDFEKMVEKSKELLCERYSKAFVEGEYDNTADE